MDPGHGVFPMGIFTADDAPIPAGVLAAAPAGC